MSHWISIGFAVFVFLLGILSLLVQWAGEPPPFGASGWILLILGSLMLRVEVLERDRH